MGEPFIQYDRDAPRFYLFESSDWGRAFAAAMSVPMHVWLVAEVTAQLRPYPLSVFSQYGVVTDRSFYCPVFTRTLNGALWLACPCMSGFYRKPCRHAAAAHNF